MLAALAGSAFGQDEPPTVPDTQPTTDEEERGAQASSADVGPDIPARPAEELPDQRAGEATEDGASDAGVGFADEGEVIVVTGSRTETPLAATPVATEVISRREIEATGGDTVAEVLANHPGLDVFPGLRGSEIRMQGLDPAYVLILVDGQRAIGRIDGAIDLERFPIESIEQIEIVKGASSALYGSDALAGVINIITRKPEKPYEAELRTKYGSFGEIDLSGRAGLRRGRWNARLSAGLRRGDGYDLEPRDIATTASSFDEWHVAGVANGSLGNVALVLSSDYLRSDLHGIDASPPAVYDRLNRVEQANGSVRAEWRPARSRRLSAAARLAIYRDQFAYDLRDSTDEMEDTYEETNERLVETTVQFDGSLGEHHFFTTGIDGLFEHIKTPRIRDSATGEPEADRYRFAGFVQDEWTITSTPTIVAAPGIRFDVDSQFGFHPTPKLALRWDATERIVVRGSYGWGYRAPDFKELYLCFQNTVAGYVIDGNPELDPETSQNINLGIELRAHQRLWASVSAYYNDMTDLIEIEQVDSPDGERVCPGSGVRYSRTNVASAFTRGVEIQMRTKPRIGPIDGLLLELSYVLNHTRNREQRRSLQGRALHRGTFKLGYDYKPIGVLATLRGSIVSGRKFFEGGEEGDTEITTDPYITLDARMATDIWQLTVFAGVSNLLDEGDAMYLQIQPRTFYGGATARY
ncbi:MAG: TonB-dependent receptor [Proteobacteria bacterium]|nr:TonB-dependent receptor [Pseudomonadota bacterium]